MLKENDMIVLRHLRENSRQSLAKLSKKTKMPISTLFDKVNKLEKEVIKKHVSLLDFTNLGYGVLVNFLIKSSSKQEIKDFLYNNPSVNSFCTVSPSFDFYAECIFKDLKEMDTFKESLLKYKLIELNETFVVDTLKKEAFCCK